MMIKRYLLCSKPLVFIFLVLACLNAFFAIGFAFVLSEILNAITLKDLTNLKMVFSYSIIFSILFIGIDYMYNYVQFLIIKKATVRLKQDLFSSMMKRSIVDFEENATGSCMNELMANCKLFEEKYFKNVCGIPYLFISFIAAAVATVFINAYLLVFMIFMGLFMLLITKYTNECLKNATREYTKSTEDYTIFIKEIFLSFALIKTSNLYKFISDMHHLKNKNTEDKKFMNKTKYLLCSNATSMLGILSTVTIMSFTGYLAILNIVTIGAVVAVGQLMGRIISPINSFTGLIMQIKSASVITDRFDKILSYQEKNDEGHTFIDFNHRIVFDQVGFSYKPNFPVLNEINLEFKKGMKYAIVGNSGCGKTTLLKLILDYFKNYEGNIFIDEINLKQIKLSTLYNKIGIVSQNVFLFNDTIKNNITLFGNYSDEEYNKAVIDSGLSEFIKKQALRDETVIGENGNHLSGGERQRIAIARALLKKYRVLLLDEVTSNLDVETAAALEQTFLELKDITIIMVTHRLNKKFLVQCDVVVTLKNGKIEEQGSYGELIQNKGLFYSLVRVNH